MKYKEFAALTPKGKIEYLKNKDMRFCLFAQQYDRKKLDRFFEEVSATPKNCQADSHGMLYFTQPSTRTFLSFDSAMHYLGMHTSEVRDNNTSSEVKGETPEDSVITFSMFSDCLVMRSPIPDLAQKVTWLLGIGKTGRKIPIVNAGSGTDQHPTQALLDVYTLWKNLKSLDGAEITLIGDLARSRTIHSLIYLLGGNYKVKLHLLAPKELSLSANRPDLIEFLKEHNVPFNEHKIMDKYMLQNSDCFYVTRCQNEYGSVDYPRFSPEWFKNLFNKKSKDQNDIDFKNYSIGVEDLEEMKETALIMHPLPRREELSIKVDRDPRAKYWEQVRNGILVRRTLIRGLMEDAWWAY